MKERPILFSGPMVRAILDGRKTQTRLVINPQPIINKDGDFRWDARMKFFRGMAGTNFDDSTKEMMATHCLHGVVGDRLYVRENFYESKNGTIFYAVDEECGGIRLRPAIHMPRAASRITLEITDVRVERLNEITQADSVAEGVTLQTWDECNYNNTTPRVQFMELWQSTYGPESWAANPFVWAITFKRVQP